jgi:hypothetical protein
VNDELPRLDKSFSAIAALMRPLSRVDPHMPMQFAAVLEASAAVRATVRLLLRVDPPVDAQILLDRKRFAAHFAHKWPFTCI